MTVHDAKMIAGMTLAALTLLARASDVRADAPNYRSVAGQSALTFSGTQQGEKFSGAFKDFEAAVAFSPTDPAGSKITATIKIKSLDSKSQDRDSALVGPDWFAADKYPVATFRTTAIRMTPTGPVGDAELTIRSTTRKLAFPFKWTSDGAKAVLDARVTLDRIDFGVGTGEWADESVAGRKVEVSVHLALSPEQIPAAAPKR